jgi:predicted nucleic acid-binding protein
MVLDTNILIYSTKLGGEFLSKWVGNHRAVISVVARIEALGFPKISPIEICALDDLMGTLPVISLEDEIVSAAISIRQIRKMGLADAIISATALVHSMPLVTRNVEDFKGIVGLEVINPFAD